MARRKRKAKQPGDARRCILACVKKEPLTTKKTVNDVVISCVKACGGGRKKGKRRKRR